jgi:hypothetical protein
VDVIDLDVAIVTPKLLLLSNVTAGLRGEQEEEGQYAADAV